MYNNVKEFFTEDEWNAIYDALADYQDHGETETELSYSAQSKITELFSWIMNYTLKQLQERVNKLIEKQGEDAECAAWIYTKEDIHVKDENGEVDYDHQVENPALIARIFDDVGQIDYIYTMIQDCVDEVTEEQFMSYQQ